MFTLLRLAVIAFVSAMLLSACGDNNNQNDQKQSTATPSNAESTASAGDKAQTVAVGTSEKDAIAKLGQPSLTQTRKIDALTVTYDEWHTDAGTIAAQFHNGVAKFSQFIPKNTK